MKKLEFETSKGRFLICDENLYLQNINGVKSAYFNSIKQFEYEYFIRLTNITEAQASEIVDELWIGYKNYLGGSLFGNYKRLVFDNATESLHSLLKSKDIHLFENPYSKWNNSDEFYKYQEAKEKTFYNPVIFKL